MYEGFFFYFFVLWVGLNLFYNSFGGLKLYALLYC